MSTLEILRVINDEDITVPHVVRGALPEIAKAVDLIVDRLSRGGSLLYIGAGTSGRLAVVDAAECLPTFGVGADTVSAVIAGGQEAMFRAVEESEDDEDLGMNDVAAVAGPGHVVVGISASGVTPYVRGGLRAARQVGAGTVAVVCNHSEHAELDADIVVSLVVGAEALTGSTRMKAGTAQKLVLNMLSTASMVKLGKVYDNLMVDMQPTNHKLRERAVRIVSMATGLSPDASAALLDASGMRVKTALVMALADTDRTRAERALAKTGGHVRPAIQAARDMTHEAE
jgi:N-acetylmuramic acid 6-phosphate etherase